MTYEPLLVPTTRRGRTTRTVLIVLGAVLAVCCLGGLCGGFWLYRTVDSATGPAREATAAYVDDVRAGNYQGAYGRLCEEARDAISQEEYTRIQSAQLKIRSYEISGVNVSSDNGRVRGAVTLRMVKEETGAEFTHTFPLVKEDGEWRVCQ